MGTYGEEVVEAYRLTHCFMKKSKKTLNPELFKDIEKRQVKHES